MNFKLKKKGEGREEESGKMKDTMKSMSAMETKRRRLESDCELWEMIK